nr:MAG TPA: hypothetical protein [Caudoviricetes sp.]
MTTALSGSTVSLPVSLPSLPLPLTAVASSSPMTQTTL